MKTNRLISILALGLLLLPACNAPAPAGVTPSPTAEAPAPTETPDGYVLTPCRIIDGADTGELILAGVEDHQVYTLNTEGIPVTMDGGSSGGSELRNGMLVYVGNTGGVLETFPARFARASTIAGESSDVNGLPGLYLQVLEDLWAVDNGLNQDITELGVDLSKLEGLTDGEKLALSYAFGRRHGLMPVNGTWEELKEQGFFTAYEIEGLYQWDEGCLFSIEGDTASFSAQKWRSPLGAYFYSDCTAKERDGVWSYTVGSEAIS